MADLPDRIDPKQLRASDVDRERVAEVLRSAAAEGRLGLDGPYIWRAAIW